MKGRLEFTSKPVNASVNQSETAQDLNTAKVAAMKAAEVVNRNLVGGSSYLSTDQKKKLLWGNKKNTSAEEGMKGEVVQERKPNEMDAEKKRKFEMDLEKQYTAGLRRTVGLGL